MMIQTIQQYINVGNWKGRTIKYEVEMMNNVYSLLQLQSSWIREVDLNESHVIGLGTLLRQCIAGA